MKEIEKIKEFIDEADYLIENVRIVEDAEFQIWYNSIHRYILNHFGENSHEYKTFYKYSLPKSRYIDDAYLFECKNYIKTIKGMLEDFLSDHLIETKIDFDCSDKEKQLERIFSRFKRVAFQLSHRYKSRETLRIIDEYDVQDLLYALLSLYFDDIRPEEPAPSYAGSSSRGDFFLPEINVVIEVKKTRKTMTDKILGEELIIDIEKYLSHSDCKKIYFFVYDPDHILRNPTAIKRDLEEKHTGLIKVFIES